MKILHIINDAPTALTEQIIEVQSIGNDVKVVELSINNISYDSIIDDIFSYDKVVSW